MDKKLTCEHTQCNKSVEVDASHSIVMVLQKVDAIGYNFFQCEDGQAFRFVNWQHFYCSHKCLGEHLPSCLHGHHGESHLHPIPAGAGTTILHKVVLGSSLVCKVCSQPLTSVAYRFCLTRATPFNRVIDESLNELGEWCCSLEHARQSALNTIQMHLDGQMVHQSINL